MDAGGRLDPAVTEDVGVVGAKVGPRPGRKGGPPPAGPGVGVELVFDQGPVDHGERAGGPAVVVGGDLLAGGPAEQPDLDPVGAQQPGVPALEGVVAQDRPPPPGRVGDIVGDVGQLDWRRRHFQVEVQQGQVGVAKGGVQVQREPSGTSLRASAKQQWPTAAGREKARSRRVLAG